MDERLLSISELAGALGRAESYIWAMRRKGFVMIGGRATVRAALRFLESCPHPRGDETPAEMVCDAHES